MALQRYGILGRCNYCDQNQICNSLLIHAQFNRLSTGTSANPTSANHIPASLMPAYGATRKPTTKGAHATTHPGPIRTIKRRRKNPDTEAEANRDAIKRNPAAYRARIEAFDAEMRVNDGEYHQAVENVRATMTPDAVIASYKNNNVGPTDGFYILRLVEIGSRIATREKDMSRALKFALSSDIDGFMQTAVKQRMDEHDKWKTEEWSTKEAEEEMDGVRLTVENDHVAQSV